MATKQRTLVIDPAEAPRDALERLVWLSGARDVFNTWLEGELRRAYFEARLTGRLESAVNLKLHSRKRVMAYTRQQNELQGRGTRWGDGVA